MATLVFGALGTLVGGPLGGAIGSLLGRELDRSIIGAPTREGPRLKELAISTSSYGQPIARLFGVTRAAGTIIWATELKESRDTVSGGKGRPSTTQYSYSVSLAVALSSRPIERVERIWANGNLLRGEAGDLKTGGSLRVHLGHADQPADPLLAAALGAQCPAHRGTAYAVFEDLALGEFGNRIPALSFEVFADGGGASLVAALAAPAPLPLSVGLVPGCAAIAGFAHESGAIAAALAALHEVAPLVVDAGAAGLRLAGETAAEEAAPLLPAAIALAEGDFGARSGRRLRRETGEGPTALRYYDSARDYQPGLQRAPGRASAAGERTLELPATLSADAAAGLIAQAAERARGAQENARLRIASLDPALAPGAVVALDGAGRWRITAWEWRSGGVELELARVVQPVASANAADPGAAWRPADRLPAATVLHALELPWDGAGASDAARLTLAVGAGEGRWSGAVLYVERSGALEPLAEASARPARTGALTRGLGGSPALMFEPQGAIEIRCDAGDAEFRSVDGAALAAGANRLLVGDEIVQFLHAEPIAERVWRLSGLLRGRAGTESEARAGHSAGARVVLLDERLLLLDASRIDVARERVAAIGAGDAEPVFSAVATPFRSRQPPTPVHPQTRRLADGGLELEWTRRARGSWTWMDAVDAPLLEQSERYEVAAGPVDAPLGSWSTAIPFLALSAADVGALPSGTHLWVRQIGTYARSPALLLHTLA